MYIFKAPSLLDHLDVRSPTFDWTLDIRSSDAKALDLRSPTFDAKALDPRSPSLKPWIFEIRSQMLKPWLFEVRLSTPELRSSLSFLVNPCSWPSDFQNFPILGLRLPWTLDPGPPTSLNSRIQASDFRNSRSQASDFPKFLENFPKFPKTSLNSKKLP